MQPMFFAERLIFGRFILQFCFIAKVFSHLQHLFENIAEKSLQKEKEIVFFLINGRLFWTAGV